MFFFTRLRAILTLGPLGFAWLLLCALYLFHFGVLGFLVGPYDYNHLSAYYEMAVRFWMQSPGLPHYNPYFCGGRTLGGDPQIPLFHPLTLASTFLLGPSVTVKGELLAQLGLGAWGLNRWLKLWKVAPPGRIWGSLLFLGGGFTVARFMVGHVTLGFYFLFPVYFVLSYQACSSRHFVKNSSFWLVAFLFVYCSLYKPNFLIYAVPTLLFEALLRSFLTKSLRPLGFVLWATLVGTMACGVTLIPSRDYFAHFPRIYDAVFKSSPFWALAANLLLPLKTVPKAWYGTNFMMRHEYSVFLGPVALWFAWKSRRAFWPDPAPKMALAGFALFCAFLGQGYTENPVYPFHWFAGWWPGFASIRVPVRFWFGTYLALIVFSAMGFSWPKKRGRQTFVLMVGVLPLLAHSFVNLSKTTWFNSGPQSAPSRTFRAALEQVHENPDTPYSAIRQGFGVLECVDNVEAYRAPLPTLTTPKMEWISWNHFIVRGKFEEKTVLRLPLNHHPYWAPASNHSIVSALGEPLSIEVPAGDFTADLEFHQPLVGLGLGVSLLTLLGLSMGGLWFWRARSLPPRIGLTGGIGSGKSTVGQLLKAHGWTVVDLDLEARKLIESDPKVIERIRETFGASVFDSHGLDRAALGQRILASASERAALNKIMHPKLMRVFDSLYRQAAARGSKGVVCEAALLVETGYDKQMDFLIGVVAPKQKRREWIAKRSGWENTRIEQAFSAQATDEQVVSRADWVISNSGSLEELKRIVERGSILGKPVKWPL
jgi:dephospho-CoA kinase